MKHILFLVALLVLPFLVSAQTCAWGCGLGAGYTDEAHAVAYDDSGNVYITGTSSGVVDFDPGPGAYNAYANTYVLKLNASGGLVWVKGINPTSSASLGWPHGNAIVLDKAGNIIVGGSFQGIVDFDPGSATYSVSSGGSGIANGFIIKLDTAGNFIWEKTLVSGTVANVLSLSIDARCNVYAAGYFGGTTDMNPGSATVNYTSRGYNDGFIASLDSAGNYRWSVQLGGNGDDRARNIVSDTAGNVYCTGYFADTVDFDPGSGVTTLSTTGLQGGFTAKYAASGSFRWVRHLARLARAEGYGVALDAKGNVYTTGYYMGTGIFNTATNTDTFSSITTDGFIIRFDTSGNYCRTRLIAGGAGAVTLPNTVTTDTLQNIYVAGGFRGSVDFDPGSGSYLLNSDTTLYVAYGDIFLMRLDSAGNFNWAFRAGGQNDDVCTAMKVKDASTIYAVGNYNVGGSAVNDTFALGPVGTNDSVSGLLNFFVTRYNQCPPVVHSAFLTINPGNIILAGTSDTLMAHVTGGGASPAYQWWLNGSAIAGATNQLYVSNALTDFDTLWCVVTSSDSCDRTSFNTDSVVIIIIVGVTQLNVAHEIVVTPNPGTGTFRIQMEGIATDRCYYTVTDVTGRLVNNGTLPVIKGRINETIDLQEDLPAGMYLLHLEGAGQNQKIRLLLQR